MASEKAAAATLRKKFRESFPGCHWQRLEDSITAGIPDVTVSLGQAWGEWWIELKEFGLPVRPQTPVKIGLKPHQALWLSDAQRAGRKVCVCARGPGAWCWFIDHFDEIQKGAPWPLLMEWAVVVQHQLNVRDAINAMHRRYKEGNIANADWSRWL